MFLFGYKETNSDLHKKFTGIGNEIIINNLKRLNFLNKPIVLRCPIIPLFNDRKERFGGICTIANELQNILSVETEPYHLFDEDKYTALENIRKMQASDRRTEIGMDFRNFRKMQQRS